MLTRMKSRAYNQLAQREERKEKIGAVVQRMENEKAAMVQLSLILCHKSTCAGSNWTALTLFLIIAGEGTETEIEEGRGFACLQMEAGTKAMTSNRADSSYSTLFLGERMCFLISHISNVSH